MRAFCAICREEGVGGGKSKNRVVPSYFGRWAKPGLIFLISRHPPPTCRCLRQLPARFEHRCRMGGGPAGASEAGRRRSKRAPLVPTTPVPNSPHPPPPRKAGSEGAAGAECRGRVAGIQKKQGAPSRRGRWVKPRSIFLISHHPPPDLSLPTAAPGPLCAQVADGRRSGWRLCDG